MSANLMPSELWSYILSYFPKLSLKYLSKLLQLSKSIQSSLKYSSITLSCTEMFLHYENFSNWQNKYFPVVNNFEFISCTYLNPTTVNEVIQSTITKTIKNYANLLIHKCFKMDETILKCLESCRSFSISNIDITSSVFRDLSRIQNNNNSSTNNNTDHLQLINFTNSKFRVNSIIDLVSHLPKNIRFFGLGGCCFSEKDSKCLISNSNLLHKYLLTLNEINQYYRTGLVVNITFAEQDFVIMVKYIFGENSKYIDLTTDPIEELDNILDCFKKELAFKSIFSCTSSQSNQNVLHKASINNNNERVKWILSTCPHYFDSVDNRGFTPFHRAVEHGHLETVKEFLEYFQTATGYYCYYYQQQKTTTSTTTKDDDKILFLSLLFRKNHSFANSIYSTSIKGQYYILLRIGEFLSNNNYLFNQYLASQEDNKNIEILRIKNKKGFEVNIMDVVNHDDKKFSPLHVAVLHGSVSCCEFLLKQFQLSPNYPNIHYQTPLHLAYRNEKNEEIIQLLIKYGAKTNLKDINGKIPSKVKSK